MPKGLGRPLNKVRRKTLKHIQRTRATYRKMRDSDNETAMHFGYEGLAEMQKRGAAEVRMTDSDMAHRARMAEIGRKMLENEKRRRADATISISPLHKPRRSRIYMTRGKK